MRQGRDSRRGMTETRAGRFPPAFWLAQGCIGLALLVLSFRHRGDANPGAFPLRHGPRERTLEAPPTPEIVPASAKTLDVISDPRPNRRGLAGAPYSWEEYRSELRVQEDRVQWTLDPRELSWLLANRRQVLAGDLETSPEPEGGLRVRAIREGSFGERRGIRVGDVLLDINGQDLDSPSDLEDFLGDPGSSGAGGWRVRLRRGEEVLLVDYRSAS